MKALGVTMHPVVAGIHSAELDRRGFLSLIAGWFVGAALPQLIVATGRAQTAAGANEEDAGYVIVNGWVLTREDVAAGGTLRDVG